MPEKPRNLRWRIGHQPRCWPNFNFYTGHFVRVFTAKTQKCHKANVKIWFCAGHFVRVLRAKTPKQPHITIDQLNPRTDSTHTPTLSHKMMYLSADPCRRAQPKTSLERSERSGPSGKSPRVCPKTVKSRSKCASQPLNKGSDDSRANPCVSVCVWVCVCVWRNGITEHWELLRSLKDP